MVIARGMGSNKSGKKLTITRTKEYGYFIRTKTRRGTKRRQKTIRVKGNPEKVKIAEINGLEFYVYPYQFPDKIFIGIYPMSISIEQEDFSRIFGIMNKLRWYFDDQWVKDPRTKKGGKTLRQRIVNAYNLGLKRMKEAQNERISP